MTVQELIEELKQYKPENEIWGCGGDGFIIQVEKPLKRNAVNFAVIGLFNCPNWNQPIP